MDDADRSDDKIQAAVSDGIARAKQALCTPDLVPLIVLADNGKRVGVCHHCESSIAPGKLFCPEDAVEPKYSCAREWEHDRQRKADCGIR